MLLDIEKYPQKLLADVSEIYTSAGFLRYQREGGTLDQMRTLLLCPDTYVPEKMEVDLVEANGIMKGYAILPRIGVNIVYLASILNSAVSWAVMTSGKLEKRTPITLKRLSTVLIRVLPSHEQQAVAYLHFLIMDIRKQKREGSTNPYLNYWESVYTELQNAIGLELALPQVFKEYEIEMLTSWAALIGKCSIEHPDFELTSWQDVIGNELLSPQNIVTGNLNKLRVVMREVVNKVQEPV